MEKLRMILGRLRGAGPVQTLKKAAVLLWRSLTQHFVLKILSLAIAILLWNNVISNNTSITRTRVINGLTGYISGQTALNSNYGLALLDDPTEQLSGISVRVQVSQADYSNVSADNVQVTLDLSSVRTAGTQEVPLRAVTSYGRVLKIIPDSLSLTFETIDSRSVPVNVFVTGETRTDRWYNVDSKNPGVLTIKGAASVVQSLASAVVWVDVTGREESFTAAKPYELLDGEGNVIPQTMLDRSAATITVNMEVYPAAEIPIAAGIGNVITGKPADGYVVESITIQPDRLTVAAEQELLDTLSEIHVEPISVEGLSQSFVARTSVSALSSIVSISADDVYVSVNIVEETAGMWVDDVSITYIGKAEGLAMEAPQSSVRVYISGPASLVRQLSETGFVATADMTGLSAGEHTLTLEFPDNYPGVTFLPETGEVPVRLEPAPGQ